MATDILKELAVSSYCNARCYEAGGKMRTKLVVPVRISPFTRVLASLDLVVCQTCASVSH